MGQACCNTNLEEKELNDYRTQGVRGERQAYDPEQAETQAALTMQRYWKGHLARLAVRQQYGFVAKTHTQYTNQMYTVSD